MLFIIAVSHLPTSTLHLPVYTFKDPIKIFSYGVTLGCHVPSVTHYNSQIPFRVTAFQNTVPNPLFLN